MDLFDKWDFDVF